MPTCPVAFDFAIGGKINHIDPVRDASEPVYVAVYDLADPSVCSSDEWVSAAGRYKLAATHTYWPMPLYLQAAACEKGRWASEIRPYTLNRAPAPGGQTVWEQIASVTVAG